MPGLKRVRTHADEFRDLEDRAPIEFDPEDDAPQPDSSDDSSPEDEAVNGISAREHYESVGRSKLRQREGALLGPQYAGSRVTRKGAGAADDEHDPFEEYGSGEESDEEKIGPEEIQASSDEDLEDLEDEDMADGSDTADTSFSDDEDEEMEPDGSAEQDRAELRKIMDEQSNVAATISQANRIDAEKGRAVKQQRKTFDALLNSRIRMQQGLIAINSTQAGLTPKSSSEDSKEPYAAAETAALNLWNTIEALRHTIASPQTSEPSPKRLKIDASTPSHRIWTYMQSCEAAAQPARTCTLGKWSRKTAAAAPTTQQQSTSRRLNPSASSSTNQTPITSVLAEHLSTTNIPRLIERTRIPRSCAPIQARDGIANDTGSDVGTIYDDADFYAHLLQDLLSQRQLDDLAHPSAGEASGVTAGGDAVTAQYRAARAASKTKRDVDTKASKGRKMRYTVHEKLQNFMAPEDRGMWGARQREELFGSLLGRKLVLEEKEDAVGEGANGEEEALMLFRS